MISIDLILGTRPELTKCAAILADLSVRSMARLRLLITSQQTTLVERTIADIRIPSSVEIVRLYPRADNPYRADWREADTVALRALWRTSKPNIVVVQGDTNSSLWGALRAQEYSIPLVHLEAGIRHSPSALPEPEEDNRRAISRLASFHLSPSHDEYMNLIGEGVRDDQIAVVGDLSQSWLAYVLTDEMFLARGKDIVGETLAHLLSSSFAIGTFHRPSSLASYEALATALDSAFKSATDCRLLICRRPDTRWHSFFAKLEGNLAIHVIRAPPPSVFLRLLALCKFVVTDSAGVQQEAVCLDKNIIVVRRQVELYSRHDRIHLVPPPFNTLPEIVAKVQSQPNVADITTSRCVALGQSVTSACTTALILFASSVSLA